MSGLARQPASTGVSEPAWRVLSAASPTWCSGPKALVTRKGPARHAGRPVRGHPREVLKLILVVLFTLTLAPADAQQRDRPATPATSAEATGQVSGVVTLSETSREPVRSAIVSLIPVDGGDGASSVTDDEGRFTIRGVPDGRYALVAEKSAHLTTQYGAKRPGRAGVPIVIAKGQAIDDVRLALPKGAVITGRLSLDRGSPARNIQVLAIPASQIDAGGRFDTRARRFFSDDQGVYRIWGLPPGDYIVAALPPEQGFGEFERRTAAQYEEAIRALRSRSSAPAAAGGPAPARASRLGYAPTYHPGTPIASDAASIRVNAGDVRDGIDIPVLMFGMSEISGTILDVSGMPTQAVRLTVTATGPPLPLSAAPLRLTPPDAQGRFTLTGVPPGLYTLTARGGGVTVDGRGTTTVRTAEQTDWAIARVQVIGDDIDGVLLSLQRGLTFSGRVDVVGADAPELKGVRVVIVAPGADPYAARGAEVNADGSFSVTGLHPETYEVMVLLPSALSGRLAVRAVTADGVELRDRPLTFDRGSLGNVAITLTDQRTAVTGTFSSASGLPASDYFVVIFPADRALWHPHSPRVRVVRPAADGSFLARDLPAGAYRLAALHDVEEDEWRQASFLETLVETSLPIVVTEGTTTRQNVRIQ
jgi:hypothetical protein